MKFQCPISISLESQWCLCTGSLWLLLLLLLPRARLAWAPEGDDTQTKGQWGSFAGDNSDGSYGSSFFIPGKSPLPPAPKWWGKQEANLLQRGTEFCSLCCPWLKWGWAVPQQPGCTWMKKEECCLFLTPHTGLEEEGFYFCLTHHCEAPFLSY